MHILIISDAYPPMRTSCATQIYDLAQAFIEQNHQVSIIVPEHSQKNSVTISNADGPTVYSVRCFKTKDVGYARRTLAEFINPFIIGFHLKRSQLFLDQKIDGIAWYSPTIFWGPLVKKLKEQFKCNAYLILRDIFPDWALDLGIIKNKLVFQLFKKIEIFQYSIADTVGVQSPNSLTYFNNKHLNFRNKSEVLWNWLGQYAPEKISIPLENLREKSILIYSGNIGVAQGSDFLFNLVSYLNTRAPILFIFIGRGSEYEKIQKMAKKIKLENILFFDEVSPNALGNFYSLSHMGIVSLDSRHKTQNIPGKFLSYLQAGLPVFAIANPQNDLKQLIEERNLGIFCSNEPIDLLGQKIIKFIRDEAKVAQAKIGAHETFQEFFRPEIACRQIVQALLH